MKKLASIDVNFDCASYNEIKLLIDLGVSPSRLLYTNPIKSPASLIFARKVGVTTVTVDNSDELRKIKQYHSKTKLHIRIVEDDDSAVTKLGNKFGVTIETACLLLEEASNLGLEVEGFSFHVGMAHSCNCVKHDADCSGTGSSDPRAHRRAIEDVAILLDAAKCLGYPVKVLDIGGGFTTDSFARAAAEIRSALAQVRRDFPTLRVIAEPGRLFANEVFTLVTQVIGRRGTSHDNEDRRLYLNDGVFGNFMNRIFEKATYQPIAVVRSGEIRFENGEGKLPYSLWGPTCDSQDCIATHARFGQEVEIGDWLVFDGMGGECVGIAVLLPTLTIFTSLRQRLSDGI